MSFLLYIRPCYIGQGSILRQSFNFLPFNSLVQAIAEVYTVEQIKMKALQNEGKPEPFYGITFAYISMLNIDTETAKIIRNRW